MAIDFMEPAWGEPIVDLSCGSGLFTREFLASRKFPFVVASDLSETMLQQAGDFLKDKSASYLSESDSVLSCWQLPGTHVANRPPALSVLHYFSPQNAPPVLPPPRHFLSKSPAALPTHTYHKRWETGSPTFDPLSPSLPGDTVLVRADVSRLPFETGSVAAIHAGAAIHCWPDPLNALADISRALAPGGVFVGSTFMVPVAPLEEILGEEAARPLLDLSRLGPSGSSAYRWWEERELRDLCKAVGLT